MDLFLHGPRGLLAGFVEVEGNPSARNELCSVVLVGMSVRVTPR